jgi:hypothetical protein
MGEIGAAERRKKGVTKSESCLRYELILSLRTTCIDVNFGGIPPLLILIYRSKFRVLLRGLSNSEMYADAFLQEYNLMFKSSRELIDNSKTILRNRLYRRDNGNGVTHNMRKERSLLGIRGRY